MWRRRGERERELYNTQYLGIKISWKTMNKHLSIQYPHPCHPLPAPSFLWNQQWNFTPPSKFHLKAPARNRQPALWLGSSGHQTSPLPEPSRQASHLQVRQDLHPFGCTPGRHQNSWPSLPPRLPEGRSSSGPLIALCGNQADRLILSVAFCQEEIFGCLFCSEVESCNILTNCLHL